MTYKVTRKLSSFEFWGGARDLAEVLTYSEFEIIENKLEEVLGEDLSETEINDLFWFEDWLICEMIGVSTEEIFNR